MGLFSRKQPEARQAVAIPREETPMQNADGEDYVEEAQQSMPQPAPIQQPARQPLFHQRQQEQPRIVQVPVFLTESEMARETITRILSMESVMQEMSVKLKSIEAMIDGAR